MHGHEHQCVVAGRRAKLRADAGPRRDPGTLPADQQVISTSHTDRQTTLVVRTDAPIHDPAWTVGELGLEDLVLAYMGQRPPRHDERPALEAVR